MKLSWPRFRRLTKRAEFTACYDNGSRYSTRFFVVFARQVEASEPAHFFADLAQAALPVGFTGGSCCLDGRLDEGEGCRGSHSSPLVLLGHTSPSSQSKRQACGRLGLAVTRKCGNAVQRNRIKRVLRAFFRLHQYDMPIMDIVVTPKRHLRADQIHLALVEHELVPLLAKLRNSLPECAPNRPLPSLSSDKSSSYMQNAATPASCGRLSGVSACRGTA